MKNLRLVAAAAMAGVVMLLASGAAQAYSDCGINLQLNDSTLVGGGNFKFTADAGAVDCAWVVTYRGQAKNGNGTSFSGSFGTPVVTKKTTSDITAACTWDDEKIASTGKSTVAPAFYSTAPATNLQAVVRTCSVKATVTLLPKGGSADDGDSLPNTGGSNLSLILLGGALLLVGGGLTYAARRRSSSN